MYKRGQSCVYQHVRRIAIRMIAQGRISNCNSYLYLSEPRGRCFTRHISSSPTAIAPQDSQILALADGRCLGYAEYGDRYGPAIFYFHGWPGSRLDAALGDTAGKKLGARIIGVDRPGMGISSLQPNRRLLDWPADVSQLARHLKLDRYRVVGGSGGGPYALACAKVLPQEELRGVGVVAGFGPWYMGTSGMPIQTRIMMNVMAWLPSATRLLFERTALPAAQNPDRQVFTDMLTAAFQRLKGPDRAVFEDEKTLEITIEAIRESYKQGISGIVEEFRVLTSPWGFQLEDITFNNVKLWYGTEDKNTPVRMGRETAKRLQYAQLIEYPGDTHWTIFANHLEDILRDILEDN